jgi:hypothetical protein
MQKRQREIKKAEKAAQKRAKRHGFVLERPAEPVPSMGADVLFGSNPAESSEDPEAEASTETSPEEETEKKEAEDES